MPPVSRLPDTVGVVGAGTMGAGIAQLACLGGYRTLIQDPDEEALEAGSARVIESLGVGSANADLNGFGKARRIYPLPD